jgi:cobalt transporter subunit CbtA
MSVFRNVVFVAALAGLVAGVVLAALQILVTDPLIFQAEIYEQAGEAPAHDHHAVAEPPAAQENTSTLAMAPAATAVEHEHDADAWQPADGIERYAFSVLANLVTGIGFALILVVASEFAGSITGWRQGLIWGLAGFAVFTLAPGLGLPPELPAMPAADLAARQVWWCATVAATAGGLALITFRRALPFAAVGLALIVAPHIVGAPQPPSYETAIPEGLHHKFVVAVTMTNLVFWAVLGIAAGALRARLMGGAESLRSRFA